MKRLLVLLAMALACGAAQAQIKIAYVDAQRIARDSVPARTAQQALEKEFAPRDQEMQRSVQRLNELRANLDKTAATLQPAERRTKEREVESLEQELQRNQAAFQEDLRQRRSEETAKLSERTERVLNTIIQAEKFDLVFKEAVYVNPGLDITDRVMKALATGGGS
jgi:outer membrane protein